MHIHFIPAAQLKPKPESDFGFGKIFTDYMFEMDYDEQLGWHDAQIRPYGPLKLDPASLVLHYAQETFEGLKAYRTEDGRILLFRPEMNARRLIQSNQRLCMPEIPEALFLECLEALLRVERDWVPIAPSSLYIRPFVFATEAAVGVHPSSKYKFMILLSPVGAYYADGLNPVRIYVEDEYIRATPGGTGAVKCGGNYAASIIAQAQAARCGFSQVLWLDGKERKYVEEVGTMNVMFKIKGQLITAPLDGTILPGITRDSILHLMREHGLSVKERPLTIDELMDAGRTGQLEEAFGTGTAAVISPIGQLHYKGETIRIHNEKIGPLTQWLYDTLTGIQWGRIPDSYGWTHEIV
ncbi:branched-chain amino acid aminotransferase [Holdemania massiliensis]|uniref:branched-chain amino acid aminotransferase n=1 Tax=Holdemania massiliensis TaxID=1468449 RepID=UPI000308E0DE|nr:branched-chain amino acid aminotransferase [Holdemania massiliensis]